MVFLRPPYAGSGAGRTAVLGVMRISCPTDRKAKRDSWAGEADRAVVCLGDGVPARWMGGGARPLGPRRAASARKFNCWGMSHAQARASRSLRTLQPEHTTGNGHGCGMGAAAL
jgi:hypothetical protein